MSAIIHQTIRNVDNFVRVGLNELLFLPRLLLTSSCATGASVLDVGSSSSLGSPASGLAAGPGQEHLSKISLTFIHHPFTQNGMAWLVVLKCLMQVARG